MSPVRKFQVPGSKFQALRFGPCPAGSDLIREMKATINISLILLHLPQKERREAMRTKLWALVTALGLFLALVCG
ncbi:MAG: hypothetical protein C4567_02925 [Deltaproteobacteria bacterium]|nr:MAG: hypothetical protein C4567_02925 [Deltaproteobacteria bacterium]